MSKKKHKNKSKRYDKNKKHNIDKSDEKILNTEHDKTEHEKTRENPTPTETSTVAADSETATTIETVDEQIAKTGYPDISKANTSWIIVVSLISVLVIFILAILFPKNTTDSSTTEATTELATTEEKFLGTLDEETGFTHLDGNIYYYEKGDTPYIGWLTKDDKTYYFNADGIMITDVWYVVDGKQYCFLEDGSVAMNQWVGEHYLDENGQKLKNTFSPDGFWIDANGTKDTTISLETSIEGLSDLKSQLEEMVSGYYGEWSIYVKDLSTNEYLVINNVQHFSASLIKLYCGATIYDLIEKGTLEETENITSLMRSMLSISDNDAFNLLVGKCSPTHDGSQVSGRKIVQDYINEHGYVDTTIATMLLPTSYRSPSSPGRNYTTVVDCGLILESIYRKQCVNEESSEKFLNLLLDQSHTNKIPAGLPEGTKCANKTGDNEEFQHDAAIVYSPNGDYIFTVMSTRGGSSIVNIRNLSAHIYQYFNPEETAIENDTLNIKTTEQTSETKSPEEESTKSTTENNTSSSK